MSTRERARLLEIFQRGEPADWLERRRYDAAVHTLDADEREQRIEAERVAEARLSSWQVTTNLAGHGEVTWSGRSLRAIEAASRHDRVEDRHRGYAAVAPSGTYRWDEVAALGEAMRHGSFSAVARECRQLDTRQRTLESGRVTESTVTDLGIHHHLLDDAELAFALDTLTAETDVNVRESLAANRFGMGTHKYRAALRVARSVRESPAANAAAGPVYTERVVEHAGGRVIGARW